MAKGGWVVTGGASGFGIEFARRLLARGESVAVWDVDDDALERVRLQLRSGPGRLVTQQVDVRSLEAVVDAAADTRDALGSIAHVVHSAGILRVGPAEEVSVEDYRLMMEVNFFGAVNLVQALLPDLKSSARIVPGVEPERSILLFVSSVSGLRGFPQLAGYSASKFAVLGFAQALRDEVTDSAVDVRCLCPPPGDTPMVRKLDALPPIYKLSRLFTAEEVVDTALQGLEHTDEPVLLVDMKSRAMHALQRAFPRAIDLVIRQVAG